MPVRENKALVGGLILQKQNYINPTAPMEATVAVKQFQENSGFFPNEPSV